MEDANNNPQSGHFEAEIAKRLFQQVMDIFIIPEIEKRQLKGDLPVPFEIRKVLIIFPPDGTERKVRFNDDVNATAEIKVKNGVTKKKGEPVFTHEIQGIGSSQLVDDEDLDSGHVLLLNIGTVWLMSFDFRYNKSTSMKYIETADQFIKCAEFGLQNEYIGPFIDNLFSAAELLAHALLMTLSNPKFRATKSHYIVKSGFNQFTHLGNSRIEYAKAINRLAALRSKGRYLHGRVVISENEAADLLDRVKSMKDEAISMVDI